VSVPKKFIVGKENVTKEDILKIRNAEVRRSVYEILGGDRFAELLDLEVINIATLESKTVPSGNHHELRMITRDNGDPFISQKQEVMLLRSREPDEIAGDYISFVRVVCHSTGHVHHLGVPNTFTDALSALAWTFGMSKEEYKPELET
jgi:hypothetical protein